MRADKEHVCLGGGGKQDNGGIPVLGATVNGANGAVDDLLDSCHESALREVSKLEYGRYTPEGAPLATCATA